MIKLIVYIFMLIFDGGLIAGTVYLVAECGWSGWWFLLTVIILSGNNPLKFFREEELVKSRIILPGEEDNCDNED